MFCGKCGAKNADDTAFCTECGAKLGGNQTEKAIPATGSNNKKVGIIAVAVIAIVVVIVAVFLFGGRSYKATINQYVNAQFKGDAEGLLKLMPEDVLEWLLEEEGYDDDELDEFIEEGEDALEEYMDDLDRYLGDDWKVSYEITKEKDLSKKKVEDLIELYEDEYDLELNISAAKTVEVEFTVKGEDDEIESSVEFCLIKIGSSWYLDVENMGSVF